MQCRPPPPPHYLFFYILYNFSAATGKVRSVLTYTHASETSSSVKASIVQLHVTLHPPCNQTVSMLAGDCNKTKPIFGPFGRRTLSM